MRTESEIAERLRKLRLQIEDLQAEIVTGDWDFYDAQRCDSAAWNETQAADTAAALAFTQVAKRELRMAETAMRSASLCNP
jgi:hypothetical protein